MNKPSGSKFRHLLVVLAAVITAGASCSSSGDEGAATTEGNTTTTTSVETTTVVESTEPPATTTPDSTTLPPAERQRMVEILDAEGLSSPDALWTRQTELVFVWDVDPDDLLNVRSAPGINSDIVATIAPESGSLQIFDTIERVGNTNWVPVEIADDGGVGWVADRFLRPQPPVGSPIVRGTPSPEILEMVDKTISALSDSTALAELVGSEGLTLAPFAYIGDETLTLTKSEVSNDGTVDRTWGFESGTGDAIVLTLDEYLSGLRGRTAITSTVEIGYDEVIGGGNMINNLADVFPTATVAEYNHPGTSRFGGLDWTSLRFVFDDDGGTLVLRALVSDQWEI